MNTSILQLRHQHALVMGLVLGAAMIILSGNSAFGGGSHCGPNTCGVRNNVSSGNGGNAPYNTTVSGSAWASNYSGGFHIRLHCQIGPSSRHCRNATSCSVGCSYNPSSTTTYRVRNNSYVDGHDQDNAYKDSSGKSFTVTVPATPAPTPPPITWNVALASRPPVDLSVTLDATGWGSAGGGIRWRFDCTDELPYETDFTNTDLTPNYTCVYPFSGTYTARVISVREGKSRNDTTVVTVSVPSVPPVGFHDITACSGLKGWARDEDSPGVALPILIYRDGPVGGGGVLTDTITANINRPDLPFPDQDHGYSWVPPKDGNPSTWYTYAQDQQTGALFPLSGTPTGPSGGSLDFTVLVIGGGGGGGGAVADFDRGGGGGGAGGFLSQSLSIDEGSVAITVGTGGAGGPSAGTEGSSGRDSSIGALLTADGGGFGGGSHNSGDHGSDGGSGGGAGSRLRVGGSGTAGQGNNGGSTSIGGGAAGGGGSSTAGSDNPYQQQPGGTRGLGTNDSISGSSVLYARGGNGGSGAVVCNGANGTLFGEGGGGACGIRGGIGRPGGVGSPGIVIIRYATSEVTSATGGTITTDGSDTVHTFTSNGTFEFTLTVPVATPPLTCYQAPIITLDAAPASIPYNSATLISWSVANPTDVTCTASGGGVSWMGDRPATGDSELSDNLTVDTNFTLSCTNPAGDTTVEGVDVAVGSPPPPIITIDDTTLSQNFCGTTGGGLVDFTYVGISSQSAYRLWIDDDADFSSLIFNSRKVPYSGGNPGSIPVIANFVAGRTYYVRAWAWDSLNIRSLPSMPTTTFRHPPKVAITVMPDPPFANSPFIASDQTDYGDSGADERYWDMGDGTTFGTNSPPSGGGASVTHTYTDTDAKTITLTVEDADGTECVGTLGVNINAAIPLFKEVLPQ